VARPRVIIYSAILGAISAAFFWGIATKPSLRVDVIRDRATLAREVEGGLIENVYRLHVINVSETPHRYAVSVSGLPGIDMVGDRIVEVPAAEAKSFSIQVRVPADSGKKGSNQIFFDVKSLADAKVAVHEKASFLQP
jgi:polyferredoxin